MEKIQKSDVDSLRDTVINCFRSQVKCCRQIEKCKDDMCITLDNQLDCSKDIEKLYRILSDFDKKLSKFDKKLSEIDDKRSFREALLHYKCKELSKKIDSGSKVWYLFLYLFLFLCIVYCTIIIIINLL